MMLRCILLFSGAVAVLGDPCPESVSRLLVDKLNPSTFVASESVDDWIAQVGAMPATCDLNTDNGITKVQNAIAAFGFDPLKRIPALGLALEFFKRIAGEAHVKRVLSWSNPAFVRTDLDRSSVCVADPVPVTNMDDLLVFLEVARGCFENDEQLSVKLQSSRASDTHGEECAPRFTKYVTTKLAALPPDASTHAVLTALRDRGDFTLPTKDGCGQGSTEPTFFSVGQSVVTPIIESVLGVKSVKGRKRISLAVLGFLPVLHVTQARPNYMDALQAAVPYDPSSYPSLCDLTTTTLRMDSRAASFTERGYSSANYLIMLVRALELIASCQEGDKLADEEIRTLKSLESRETRFVRDLGSLKDKLSNAGSDTVELITMVLLMNAMSDAAAQALSQLVANAQYERENNDMIEETLRSLSFMLALRDRPIGEVLHSGLHHIPKALKEVGARETDPDEDIGATS